MRLLLAVLLSTVGVSAASAHAFLDHAVPAVGSTVAHAPAQLSLWFTEGVEPAFSGVTVLNAAGRQVETGKAHRASGTNTELQVPVKQLPPGSYKVEWHVMSVDTHKTEGDYSFTVGKP